MRKIFAESRQPSTINIELLKPFLMATGDTNPKYDAIERYIDQEKPGTKERTMLRAWQQLQEHGAIATEVCTSCWTIAVQKPNDEFVEPLLLNTCSDCYTTICIFCHQHVPGPREEDCLCNECARNASAAG